MNFDQWNKLPGPRQRKIAKSWDLQKGEGREIATAVLRVFIGRYGSNKGIGIDSQVIRMRDNAGWAIGIQCFNEDGLKTTPAKYMGIAVSRFHIDHIDDGVFSQLIPLKITTTLHPGSVTNPILKLGLIKADANFNTLKT